MRRSHVRRCIVCGREFKPSGKGNKFICSEECRKKREKMYKKKWLKTFKGRICAYKSQMRQLYKNKPTDFLIYKLHLSLARIEVIDRILKERGINLLGEEDEKTKN